MAYMHIDNLYKDASILIFKECYAMEKIHGTSAHVSWNPETKELTFFSGGEKHERFVNLFDSALLKQRCEEKLSGPTTFYGEAYGGKQQAMSGTYGPNLKFIVFDVKIGDSWLDVPKADALATSMGLEFVYYQRIPTDLSALDKARDEFSTQAKRNGITEDKIQEGVVLRPLYELTKNNGKRIICKHKRVEFGETKKEIKVDPARQAAIEVGASVAFNWVTPMRLDHVLDKMGNILDMSKTGDVIKAMIEDVKRESEGIIVWTPETQKEVGKAAAKLYGQRVREQMIKVC